MHAQDAWRCVSSPKLVGGMFLDDLRPDQHVHHKAPQVLQPLHEALQAVESRLV